MVTRACCILTKQQNDWYFGDGTASKPSVQVATSILDNKNPQHIEAGGQFDACAELIAKGFNPVSVERWSEGGEKTRKAKAASKTRYSCPECGTNARAKPDVHLICGECDERMEDSAWKSITTRPYRVPHRPLPRRLS